MADSITGSSYDVGTIAPPGARLLTFANLDGKPGDEMIYVISTVEKNVRGNPEPIDRIKIFSIPQPVASGRVIHRQAFTEDVTVETCMTGKIDQLGIADVNGDGKSDIFYAYNDETKIIGRGSVKTVEVRFIFNENIVAHLREALSAEKFEK